MRTFDADVNPTIDATHIDDRGIMLDAGEWSENVYVEFAAMQMGRPLMSVAKELVHIAEDNPRMSYEEVLDVLVLRHGLTGASVYR